MEQSSLRLMQLLRARGYEIEWISLTPQGAFGHVIEEQGFPIRYLGYRGPLGVGDLFRLRRFVRQARPDAIIQTGHNLMAMLAMGRVAKGHRMLAIHFHHFGEKPMWQWGLFYRLARRLFNGISFPSDFIREEAELVDPAVREVAATVRNPLIAPRPIDAEKRAAARLELELPASVPVIGNAGWLIPRKRWDVFLEVAAQVHRKRPDTVFVIAGDGPCRRELEAQCRKLGMNEHTVRWLGWQEDMSTFYAALDILLFNTDFDAFPTTPLEAIWQHIPVVASVGRSGLPEILEHGVGGCCLREHDVVELSEWVLRYLQNPEEALADVDCARRKLAAEADDGRISQQVLRLLKLEVPAV